MKFVLDTNAVSETIKVRPNSGFMQWHGAQDPADLLICSITLAEVWYGFHRLGNSHPDYEKVKNFALGLPENYAVLNFDEPAAKRWGEMIAQAAGPSPLRDSFIAAIVRSRKYRIVTRDHAAYERMGCKVLNPWT